MALENFNKNLEVVFTNIDKIVVNKEVKTYCLRMGVEIERLKNIHISNETE